MGWRTLHQLGSRESGFTTKHVRGTAGGNLLDMRGALTFCHPLVCSAGQVVLPCDLLRFESRFRPAILRAFGSHVLAASDAGIRPVCWWLLACTRRSSFGCWHPDVLQLLSITMAPTPCTAVAEQLITRFSLPSITPDGRVTSHGTLQVHCCYN